MANIFKSSHEEQSNEAQANGNNNQDQQQQPLTKYPYLHHERDSKRKRWKENKRAGLFYDETQKSYIDQKGSFQWLQNVYKHTYFYVDFKINMTIKIILSQDDK